MWGDVGRCGEMWGERGLFSACCAIEWRSFSESISSSSSPGAEMRGDTGRHGETWGDLGKPGEIWGDMGRYGSVVQLA